MSTYEILRLQHAEAFNRGRVVPLLIDYRPAELPGHTVSVIGLIDSRTLEGAILPDDYKLDDVIRFPLPRYTPDRVAELKVDSTDAQAVHEIWSQWNSGAHEDYLRLVRTFAMIRAKADLIVALREAVPMTSKPAADTLHTGQAKAAEPKRHRNRSAKRKASPS